MITRFWPVVAICSLFLLLKLSSRGVRVSDTNIYFYTAYQLVQGKLLYKDLFFTNFPLLPYVSVVYYFLVGKHLDWYYLTASLEVIATGSILYYLVLSKTKSLGWASITLLCYLFSFITLSTSDHQTGVFLASLFAMLAYLMREKNQWFWAGVFLGLMLMTKAYFLPVAISLILVQYKQKKALLLLITGIAVATSSVLLPSLMVARQAFIRDVFVYSLTRSQGIAKTPLLWFFITHDLLLIATLLFSLFAWKKYPFFALLSATGIAFILLYQDLYYLYLNFLVPFLCLLIAPLGKTLEKHLHLHVLTMATLMLILLSINLAIYRTSYQDLQKIPDVSAITATIKTQHPPVLYGTNTIAPALSYLTGIPLLDNLVDTNENIYRKGFLNAKMLTNRALSAHALFITQGASYPEYGIDEEITDGIFDTTQMQKKCKLIGSFPITEEGGINRINLISCTRYNKQ